MAAPICLRERRPPMPRRAPGRQAAAEAVCLSRRFTYATRRLARRWWIFDGAPGLAKIGVPIYPAPASDPDAGIRLFGIEATGASIGARRVAVGHLANLPLNGRAGGGWSAPCAGGWAGGAVPLAIWQVADSFHRTIRPRRNHSPGAKRCRDFSGSRDQGNGRHVRNYTTRRRPARSNGGTAAEPHQADFQCSSCQPSCRAFGPPQRRRVTTPAEWPRLPVRCR